MKKYISILLCITLILTMLAGCTKSTSNADTSGNENIETRIIVDNDDGDDADNYIRVDFIKPKLL